MKNRIVTSCEELPRGLVQPAEQPNGGKSHRKDGYREVVGRLITRHAYLPLHSHFFLRPRIFSVLKREEAPGE